VWRTIERKGRNGDVCEGFMGESRESWEIIELSQRERWIRICWIKEILRRGDIESKGLCKYLEEWTTRWHEEQQQWIVNWIIEGNVIRVAEFRELSYSFVGIIMGIKTNFLQ